MKTAIQFLAVLTIFLIATNQAIAQARKPNIIFIIADDLGYGDLGCYGQKQIKTPNIDRLATEGTRFTQVYAGAPVCAPSRCSLITGLTNGHNLVRGNLKVDLRPEDVTVGEVLKTAGYSTGLVGKWGLGAEGSTGVPNKQGFDFFYGFIDQTMAHNSWPSFLVRNETRDKLRNVVPNEGRFGQGVATERHDFANDLMHNEVLKYIDQNKANPFFLYVSYTQPHANNESQSIEVTDMGPYKDTDWPEPQKLYAAAVMRLDQYVGEIMARVKSLGIENDTIIMFTSDNGTHQEGRNDAAFFQSSGPLRGMKRFVYEGGIRVPMIVRCPGKVPAGATSDVMWAFWDLLPTAAELAGASEAVPKTTDGISFAPTLLGKPQPRQHEYLYWEFHEGGFSQAIRMGDWKAVRFGLNGAIELYDLKTDLGETKNVAEQNQQVVQKMTELFKSARTESTYWPVAN